MPWRAPTPNAARLFLTAEWRHLVMLNWRVEPKLLTAHVPSGTTLDTSQGAPYISLVGFLFLGTRVLGVRIPFHRDFEEVNLRFYVRRETGAESRRGVCFLRELVPRTAIALTARLGYNEPYRAVPMRHRLEPAGSHTPALVEYAWRERSVWNRIVASPTGAPMPCAPGSHEEFITEHHWGYTRQRDGGTLEYQVTHPPWRVRKVPRPTVHGDLAATYGKTFAGVLAQEPESAMLADGSPVAVHLPTRLQQ